MCVRVTGRLPFAGEQRLEDFTLEEPSEAHGASQIAEHLFGLVAARLFASARLAAHQLVKVRLVLLKSEMTQPRVKS